MLQKTENRENKFMREDITALLCEVATQYAKLNGPPLKVLIYGGAAVTLRHRFRTTTHDIDYAPWEASSLFENCVETVRRRYGLFPRWMHSLDRFMSAPRFRENFCHHADALRLDAEFGNLSFLVQDSDWQLANKLCWFRRDRTNDGLDIVGIMQERDGDAAGQVSRIVRDVYGEGAICSSDGTMLTAALERVNLDELAVRLDRRARYYEKVYRYLFPILRASGFSDAYEIYWTESLFWRTEEDIKTTLAQRRIDLPPIIVKHIARVMFKPEFWDISMLQSDQVIDNFSK